MKLAMLNFIHNRANFGSSALESGRIAKVIICVLEKEGVPTRLSACSSCLCSLKDSKKGHYMLLQNLHL